MQQERVTQQLQSLREGSGNGGSRAQRKQQEKTAAAKQDAKQKLGKLQAEASMWKAKAESQGAARGRLEVTVQDLRQQLEDALAKVGKSASRLPSQEGTSSQKKLGCHDNEIGQKISHGSADAGESDPQDVSTDSELDPVTDAANVLTDSKIESSVAEDVTCDDTAAAGTAPLPAHVQEEEAEKRVELDGAAVEEKLMSPRDSAGVDSFLAAGERAGAGASTQIGTSLQLDGAPVQLARSGPPATLGGSSLTRRPAATTLDGRGVTAADMMRQAQQRRAANKPSSGNSQPTVANLSGAANAGTGATWSAGRSTHGLAGAGAIGLRGPSSVGANLQRRPQAMKNWGGNPFGSAGAASSKQTPGLAVLGSSAAGGVNSTWTPIVAGGLQFRGRRR